MQVAMMLYAGFRLLEVTGPMDVFHEANRLCGATLYEQHLVGASPGPVLCSNGVAVGTTESLSDASYCIRHRRRARFAGHRLGARASRTGGLAWRCRTQVRRLASVSNGAFLIARAGLADHRALTRIGATHNVCPPSIPWSTS